MTEFYYAFDKDAAGEHRVQFVSVETWKENGGCVDVGAEEAVLDDLHEKLNAFESYDLLEEDNATSFFVPLDCVAPLTQFLQAAESFTANSPILGKVNASEVIATAPLPAPPAVSTPDGVAVSFEGKTVTLPELPDDGMTPAAYKHLSHAFDAYAHYLEHMEAFKRNAKPRKPQTTKTVLAAQQEKKVTLLKGFEGEVVETHTGFVVYVKQNGVTIGQTKECPTREDALDIALRFSQLIPGLCKPGEFERKK